MSHPFTSWRRLVVTLRSLSTDQFTTRMIEKYGENFYETWTSREQDRYATLRLREVGVQRRGRTLRPKNAFLCTSCAALVLAASAASPLLPPWYDSTQTEQPLNGDQQLNVAQADQDTPSRPSVERPQRVPLLPSPPSDELEQATPPKSIPRSHEYYTAKPTPPPKLKPIVKEKARALAARANKQYADGEYILASHLFKEIIELGAATAATHNNLGCCLFQISSSNEPQAIKHFSIAIDHDSSNSVLYQNRGKALARQPNPKRRNAGKKDLTTALDLKDTNKRQPVDPINVVLSLRRPSLYSKPKPLRKKTGRPINQVTPTSR